MERPGATMPLAFSTLPDTLTLPDPPSKPPLTSTEPLDRTPSTKTWPASTSTVSMNISPAKTQPPPWTLAVSKPSTRCSRVSRRTVEGPVSSVRLLWEPSLIRSPSRPAPA